MRDSELFNDFSNVMLAYRIYHNQENYIYIFLMVTIFNKMNKNFQILIYLINYKNLREFWDETLDYYSRGTAYYSPHMDKSVNFYEISIKNC